MFQEQDEPLRRVCEALASLPVEAVVTTGPAIDPSELPASDNLRFEVTLSHDTILPHADLVITHGGLGTAMFSAGAGVPMLVLPNGRDQEDNAALIATLGLGRHLPRDAEVMAIAKAAAAMLQDARLRSMCQKFASRQSRFGDLAKAADLVIEAAMRTGRRP